MAHVPPSLALFSPSVARQAASVARDWTYVDTWLAAKYPDRAPPPFERNPDTLRALLALAAANETADEERDSLARACSAAIEELEDHHAAAAAPRARDLANLRANLLDEILARVSREGLAALDALAAAAASQLITAAATTTTAAAAASSSSSSSSSSHAGLLDHIGLSMALHHAELLDVEQMTADTRLIRACLAREAAHAAGLLDELGADGFQPVADLGKKNHDLQRRIKAMTARLAEPADRTDGSAGRRRRRTVDEVAALEREYLALAARRRELEDQVDPFQGLSPDPDLARTELDRRRQELQSLTQRRDSGFESLVERGGGGGGGGHGRR